MRSHPTPLTAIRAKCLDCSADQPAEVKHCPITDCPLHPFRFGKLPQKNRRVLSEEKKAAMVARLHAAKEKRPINFGGVDHAV